MNEDAFHKKLEELVTEIGTLPEGDRTKLEALAQQTKQRHEHIRHTIGKAQDGIDNLRLSIKYLLFDLEATRRENKRLRDMLDGGKKNEQD